MILQGKQASIFGTEEMAMGESAGGGSSMLDSELSTTMNSLKNVTITKATVLQSFNTFPVALGVTISGLPTNEVSCSPKIVSRAKL